MVQQTRLMQLANQVKLHIQEISPAELAAKLKKQESVHLIDVREQSEWQQEHIPQAMHLSRGMLECQIERVIPEPDAEIILYCSGGIRSALAAENLQRMGYHNVYSLQGGYKAWKETT